MYGQRTDELSPELILSIQRILDIKSSSDSDPLDTLSDDLSTTDILNSYFPDGQYPTWPLYKADMFDMAHIASPYI